MPETQTTSVSANLNARPFRTAAVLGAGVMGSQIAAHLANAGLTVHLLDLPGEDGDKNRIVEQAFQKAQKVRPDPFFTEKMARRISLGNFDDHLDRIAEADWVIEAVIERLEVKQEIMAQVEKAASDHAIISTNTSGIPIHLIAEGRSQAFQSQFLGAHFFNPPRYLKLLEVIPHPETHPDVIARFARFGRIGLGKGVVIAKDVPGFIGNRIGTYALMQSIREMTDGDYTVEEIDVLTGVLAGRPASATFRTADLVGLDTLVRVVEYLYGALPQDDGREMFQLPELVRRLVEKGAIGAKAGQGFYRKEGETILSVNPDTMAYDPPKALRLENLDGIRRHREVDDRLRALYADGGRAGAFFRRHIQQTLGYAARRIPEIADSPADVDRALRWGFGWEMGPFEIWDAIGFDRVVQDMADSGVALPDWIKSETAALYSGTGASRKVVVPGKGYVSDAQPPDEIHLSKIRSDVPEVIHQNDAGALLDLGDGVALYEFRSKANTMGRAVVEGIVSAIDRVEQGDYRGLVIGNEGKHFSVGANLNEMVTLSREGSLDLMEQLLLRFQAMIQRVHYAAKPVVVAIHGRVLGGGCELTMACPNPVAAAESYLGLVELAVGLIPAGGGTMRTAVLAHERAPTEHPSHIQPYLKQMFETIALAKVSGSAHQAKEYGFLSLGAPIVMDADRRLYVAKEEVTRLSNQGYTPPPARNAIQVLGKSGRAPFEVSAYTMQQSRYATEYDRYLVSRLAYVVTGGNLTGPALVHEDYLLELEREVFLSLLGEEKTRARIDSILQKNKPLRN